MWGAPTGPAHTISIVQGIKDKVGDANTRRSSHTGPISGATFPSFFEDVEMIKIKEQPKQTVEEARKAFDDAVAAARRT